MSSIEQVAIDFRRMKTKILDLLQCNDWAGNVVILHVKDIELCAWEAKKRIGNLIADLKEKGEAVPCNLYNVQSLANTVFKLHYQNNDYLAYSASDKTLFRKNMEHVLKYLKTIDELLTKKHEIPDY